MWKELNNLINCYLIGWFGATIIALQDFAVSGEPFGNGNFWIVTALLTVVVRFIMFLNDKYK